MKESIVRYVGRMKTVSLVLRVALILFTLVALVFAFNGYIGYMILAGVSVLVYIALYVFYASKISMDVVMGIEQTKEVVHLKVKRKTFTYDAETGCIGVKEYAKKYVCTFQTQDSVDRFTFYKRAPFAKPYETGFTEREIRAFCPRFDEIVIHHE